MNKAFRLPVVTLMLVSLIFALFISGNEQALAACSYKRTAIFDGQYWRLLTGHLTHYSVTHMAWDLLAFAVLATLTEHQLGRAGFAKLLLSLALVISTTLLLWVPAMETYAGISGINYDLLGFLGLQQAVRVTRKYGLPMIGGLTAIVGLLAFLFWQQATVQRSLFTDELAGVRIAWQAHVAGVLAAALFAAQRYYRLGFPRTRG